MPPDAPIPGPAEFSLSSGDEGSSFAIVDTVEVECVGDEDNEPFPFTASDVEFTISPGGLVDGSATWSDSVGLSMNALISGSADESLGEINVELTAPNGDTLSEMTFAGSL